MQTTEIIDLVQQRAGLASTEAANDAVVAVVETLAERDLGGEQGNFAAQLPKELGEVLSQGDSKNREQFDAAEMVRRVGERLGTTEEQSEARVHAALSALAASVSDGERLDFLNALPNDFSPYAVWSA